MFIFDFLVLTTISYFDIIKDPMDLGTMSAKLEAKMYKDRFEFQTDFRIMIANAKHYNSPGSFVHNAAISLEVTFDKRESPSFPKRYQASTTA